MNEIKEYTEKVFDDIKHIDDKDNEYWLARELQNVLGYHQWQSINDLIERAKIARNAAKKIFSFGMKDILPSSPFISLEPLRASLPINGPITPGTKTCEKILIPWNFPASPTGVKSLIFAPKTAIPQRYPHIIRSEPINTGTVCLKINKTT